MEDSSLLKVASYDLGTNSNSVNVHSFKEQQYMTSNEIINNVREGHSELLIERREENSNSKRQPDYIVAFDTIRDMDRKAAKEFGIPIVLIRSEKVALSESAKLFNLYQEILENPDQDKISKLFNEYHNNYAGLIQINSKLNKKYFNPKKFEKMMEDIIERIYYLDDNKQKEELFESLIKLMNKEDEKRMFINKKCVPFFFDNLRKKISNNSVVNVEFSKKTNIKK